MNETEALWQKDAGPLAVKPPIFSHRVCDRLPHYGQELVC